MLAGKAGRLLLAAALIIALGAPAISASAREPVMLNAGPSPSDWRASKAEPAPEKAPPAGAERDDAADGQTVGPADGRGESGARADHPHRTDHPHRAERPAPAMPKPDLTEKQRKELAKLHKSLFETKRKLIGKYAEFGLITREQASLWLNRLEARYEKLKENGFAPAWKRCGRPDMPGSSG